MPGDTAAYEKYTGIFCVPCAPADPEEIRDYRQTKANAKAERYDEWARKRKERAEASLSSHAEYRHDWAFITQPGHIPARARMIAADDRAYESLKKAHEMERKAASLRAGIRVKGEAERKYEQRREKVLSWLKVGMEVNCMYGQRTVTKINRKTARLEGLSFPVELHFLSKA